MRRGRRNQHARARALLSVPNSRAFKFTGLERGKDTWFRVRARNPVGPGP